jgi:hypothetical protein
MEGEDAVYEEGHRTTAPFQDGSQALSLRDAALALTLGGEKCVTA